MRNLKKVVSLVMCLGVISSMGSISSMADETYSNDIVKVYGTTSMTYAEYFSGEYNTTPDLIDIDGMYDAVTTATTGKAPALVDIVYADTEANPEAKGTGISMVDVYADTSTITDITVDTLLDTYGITATYFEYADGSLTDVDGNSIEKLPFANVKPLNSDGSYGKAETVENSGSTTVDYNVSLTGVDYTTIWGDATIDIAFTDGNTIASDNEFWKTYRNSIYTITLTDDNGNEYGLLWGEDIWGGSRNSTLELAINVDDSEIKGELVEFKRFSELADKGGSYTFTIKSRGYQDVTIADVDISTLLSTKPTAQIGNITNDTLITLDTTGVLDTYVSLLPSVKYNLKYGRSILEDVSDYVTTNEDGTISINNVQQLGETYGFGSYSLIAELDGYSSPTYSFNVISTMEQPYILIGEDVYYGTDNIKATKSDILTLVDSQGNAITNYNSSNATITVNGEQVTSTPENPITVVNYDTETGISTIDLSNDFFEDNTKYDISITTTGYKTFNYTILVGDVQPKYATDVNLDGKTNSLDLLILKKVLLGLISEY